MSGWYQQLPHFLIQWEHPPCVWPLSPSDKGRALENGDSCRRVHRFLLGASPNWEAEAQTIPYHTGTRSGLSSSSRLALTTRDVCCYTAQVVRVFGSSPACLRGYVKVWVHFL